MIPGTTEEKNQETEATLDEPWFADAAPVSTPTPASTRSQRISSIPPAEPIGDREADDWFR
jgi:hypothetical protein